MTYTELQATIAQWMNRGDLAAVIPTFIELTEERFNRHLRVRAMELPLASTPIVDGQITLAPDVADVKLLWAAMNTKPLQAATLEAVIASGSGGVPSMYARQGQILYLNGGGSVAGVLYQRIPALSGTNATNWLSLQAPSAYLFGALVEAKIYIEADSSVMEARLQTTLNELSGNDQRYPGPLVARVQ